MSNLILPDLPGLESRLTRSTYTNVITYTSANGNEARLSYWFNPRNRFELHYDGLRQQSALPELATLAGFLAQHFGSLDSFLIRMPDDSAVTNMGFAVGTGATLGFQLQRTRVTAITDKSGGPYVLPTVPTTNYLHNAVAQWTLSGCTSAVGSIDPIAGNAGTTLTPSGAASMSQTATATNGAYTASIFLRSHTAGSHATLAGVPIVLTTSWARYSAPVTISTGSVAIALAWSDSATLEYWGSQLELGTATAPIVTTTTNVVRTPAYYPAYTGGFEPIYEIGNDFSMLVNGAAVSNWTLQPNGAVSFTAGHAPSGGSVLTWSGSYFWRVRLDADGVDFERVVSDLWKTGSLKLLGVNP